MNAGRSEFARGDRTPDTIHQTRLASGNLAVLQFAVGKPLPLMIRTRFQGIGQSPHRKPCRFLRQCWRRWTLRTFAIGLSNRSVRCRGIDSSHDTRLVRIRLPIAKRLIFSKRNTLISPNLALDPRLSHQSSSPQITPYEILHGRLVIGQQIIHAPAVAELLRPAHEGVEC